VEQTTLEFLKDAGAKPGRPVLDLACGSGLYTEALLQEGVDAYGLDLSPDLLTRAQARSTQPQRFLLADMRDISSVGDQAASGVLPDRFDLVFCIGNSISHLESAADVRGVLQSLGERLTEDKGCAVVQYVDMEEIDIGSTRELPTLTFGDTRFERRYRRSSTDRAVFEAALVDKRTGIRDTIQNELLVLSSTDMVRWFGESGYESVQLSGGFGSQSISGSWVRVLQATRSPGS
jgi:glycine/sarcosine N-methyltransferase